MSLRSSAAALLLLTTALVACGESHGDEDTGISFDAMMPDGGTTDGGGDVVVPPAGDVGNACDSAAMCDELCIEADMGFPDGYCTVDCSLSETCPDGSVCTQVAGGVFLCLAGCDPSGTERSCRSGYGCASSLMLDGAVCIPGCYDDTDCPSGSTCNPDGGFAGEGSCYDASASLGDPCTDDSDVPGGCLLSRRALLGLAWRGVHSRRLRSGLRLRLRHG